VAGLVLALADDVVDLGVDGLELVRVEPDLTPGLTVADDLEGVLCGPFSSSSMKERPKTRTSAMFSSGAHVRAPLPSK
jgi:hypothetical protein